MTLFSNTCDFGFPDAKVRRFINGAHIIFKSGFTVSAQWMSTNYSSNRRQFDIATLGKDLTATTVEVVVWDSRKRWVRWPDGDTILGWRTWDQVQAILKQAEAGDFPAERGYGYADGDE